MNRGSVTVPAMGCCYVEGLWRILAGIGLPQGRFSKREAKAYGGYLKLIRVGFIYHRLIQISAGSVPDQIDSAMD